MSVIDDIRRELARYKRYLDALEPDDPTSDERAARAQNHIAELESALRRENSGMGQSRRIGANPFWNRSAIADPAFFFGREAELREAYFAMSTRPPSPFAIYGERRTGKSSILKQLLHLQQQKRFRFDPRDLRLVFVDFTLNLPRSDAAFVEALHEALCRYILHEEKADEARAAQAEQYGRGLNQSENPVLPPAWKNFRDHLESLAADGRYVVFLLDEAEVAFRNANVSTEILIQLRALVTDGRYNVSFVVSTLNPLAEIGEAFVSSKFHQIFMAHKPIGLLEPADADALLTTLSAGAGIPFTEDDRIFINDMAGLHPYLLQIAGYYVFDGYLDALGREQRPARDATLPEIDPLAVAERYEEFVWQNYYQTVWRHLPEQERVTFHNIAARGRMPLDQLPAEQAAGLLRKGYLLQEDGETARLFARSLEEFVLEQALTPVAELRRREADELRRTVWGLIEELETSLRELVQARLAADHAGDPESFLISRYPELHLRWSRLQERTSSTGEQESYLATIFDYAYLGELQQLLAGEWALFAPVFGTGRAARRKLADRIQDVIPVRNGLAHFRPLPALDLKRAEVACEELLAQIDAFLA